MSAHCSRRQCPIFEPLGGSAQGAWSGCLARCFRSCPCACLQEIRIFRLKLEPDHEHACEIRRSPRRRTPPPSLCYPDLCLRPPTMLAPPTLKRADQRHQPQHAAPRLSPAQPRHLSFPAISAGSTPAPPPDPSSVNRTCWPASSHRPADDGVARDNESVCRFPTAPVHL